MGRRNYEELINEIKKYAMVVNSISEYNDVLLEKQMLDFIGMNPTTISYIAFKALEESGEILCTNIEKSFGKDLFPIKVYKVGNIPSSNIGDKYKDIKYITYQWYDIKYNKLTEKAHLLTSYMDKFQHGVSY